jgi:hypothetical protein
MARTAAISAADLDRSSMATFARPMPCSAEIVPPCGYVLRARDRGQLGQQGIHE